MHYYARGSSFQRVKDVHLIAAIKTLRPDDDLLPNRRQLATSLLDACHEDVKTKVTKGMIGATSYLINDGRSNVNNDAIINYMAASPEFALFLESVSTCQQGHDHKFIADDIERVIREHPSTIFAGAVTDYTFYEQEGVGLIADYLPITLLLGVLFPWPSSIRQGHVCGDEDKKKSAKSRPPIPTNTHSSSCWNLLLTARMSSSTFTTITSPRLTYEICSSLPVLERSYEPLRLVGEQFKPCARPYWSQNGTCMSSSPLATLCKVHLPRKVGDQR
jgi:hypothetical protein